VCIQSAVTEAQRVGRRGDRKSSAERKESKTPASPLSGMANPALSVHNQNHNHNPRVTRRGRFRQFKHDRPNRGPEERRPRQDR